MKSMHGDLLRSWSDKWTNCLEVGPPYIFPGDDLDQVENVVLHDHDEFVRSRVFESQEKKCLHLGLLPQPYVGNPATAKVVLLSLNPGCSYGEYVYDQNDEFRSSLLANISLQWEGPFPFIFLNPAFAWHSGFAYWTQHLNELIQTVQQKCSFKSYSHALEHVSQRIACIEMVPYHSIASPALKKCALRSTQFAAQYVNQVLASKASGGECLIIALRKADAWGEYCPEAKIHRVKNPRSASISSGNCPSWNQIVDMMLK